MIERLQPPARLAGEWRRADPDGVAALERSAAALEARQTDYPVGYRSCPICKAKLGEPCRSRSGRIVNGRPDGVITELDYPHVARKRRTRRK